VEELVRAAQGGDPAAMNALMTELMPYLGRICGSVALDHGDDALQETFIVVFRRLRTLREPAAIRGWARRIAVREAVRVARRARPAEPSDVLDDVPGRVDPELGVDVADVLRRLGPEQRAILVLRDAEGMDVAAAAELLSVAPGTVKSRLHRARAAFRSRWEGR
jgi:RNA polymerase sigma-70 factor (ECF subfamily)